MAYNGRLPGDLAWGELCRYVEELECGSASSTASTHINRTRLNWLQNMAWGLRILSADRTAVHKWRCRAANNWSDKTPRNPFHSPNDQDDQTPESREDRTTQINIDFLLNEAHIPDIETTADIAKSLYVNSIINNLQNITSHIVMQPLIPMEHEEARTFIRRRVNQGQRTRDSLKLLITAEPNNELDINEPTPIVPPE